VANEPLRGQGGPGRGQGRPPKARAREQLVLCARLIAGYNGYPDLVEGLQPVEGLQAKYQDEIEEFKGALRRGNWLHWLHKASDVIYYAAQLDVQQGTDLYPDALRECAQLMRFHGLKVTAAQIERGALAKYEWRASGNKKDEEHELSLISKATSIRLESGE
jgi:hypothetical protein